MTTADDLTPQPLSAYWEPEEGISLTEMCDCNIVIYSVEEFESDEYGKGCRAYVCVEDGEPDFEAGRRYLTYTFSKDMVGALSRLAEAFRADPTLATRGVRALVTKKGRRYILR